MRLVLLLSFVLCSVSVDAQELLTDKNGDEAVNALAFGDSITFGVGDGTKAGEYVEEAPVPGSAAGYPSRLSALVGIPVVNSGVPGEVMTTAGVARFPAAIQSSSTDLVIIFEGANDAIFQTSPSEFRRNLQQMVNVSRALGRETLLVTIPPPCCDSQGPELYTSIYSSEVRNLAAQNELKVIDIEKTWSTTCEDKQECELYNLPEGLHPNSKGYKAIAQTAAAVLFEIDIFSQEGAAALEDSLGLEQGQVIVKPSAQITEEG